MLFNACGVAYRLLIALGLYKYFKFFTSENKVGILFRLFVFFPVVAIHSVAKLPHTRHSVR